MLKNVAKTQRFVIAVGQQADASLAVYWPPFCRLDMARKP